MIKANGIAKISNIGQETVNLLIYKNNYCITNPNISTYIQSYKQTPQILCFI